MSSESVDARGDERACGYRSRAWYGSLVDARKDQVVVIAPQRGLQSLGLDQLWDHRALLAFFIWRDVKVRYASTVLGLLWGVVQPAVSALVYLLVFGRLARVDAGELPYALFALSGVVPWALFSAATMGAVGSVSGAANLVRKVYFPRLVLPFATIGSAVIDALVPTTLVLVMGVVMGRTPGLHTLAAPIALLFVAFVALGVGSLLGALNARYRDFYRIGALALHLWLFASPVVYPVRLVPERWQVWYYLNPMAGAVDFFRWAATGIVPESAGGVALSFVVACAIALVGISYFRQVERSFADYA